MPKPGAGSALLSAPWGGSQQLSRASRQHWRGTGEALASCPASPQTQGWPGREAYRSVTSVGAALLAQGAKRQLEAWGRGGQTCARAGLGIWVCMG